jgi:competence protein ComEA
LILIRAICGLFFTPFQEGPMKFDRNYLVYLFVGVCMGIIGTLVSLRLRNQTLPAPIIIVPPEPTATPLPTATPGPLNVFVSGAVVAPAVYQLPPGSIVAEAIEMAGGFTRRAAQEQVNQALSLSDGMQIHVPEVGETAVVIPPISAPTPTAVSEQPAANELININSASQGELTELPGIGPSTAAAIIEYREQNGPFASVDDITKVSGIGPVRLEQIRHLITVGE